MNFKGLFVMQSAQIHIFVPLLLRLRQSISMQFSKKDTLSKVIHGVLSVVEYRNYNYKHVLYLIWYVVELFFLFDIGYGITRRLIFLNLACFSNIFTWNNAIHSNIFEDCQI